MSFVIVSVANTDVSFLGADTTLPVIDVQIVNTKSKTTGFAGQKCSRRMRTQLKLVNDGVFHITAVSYTFSITVLLILIKKCVLMRI